MKSWEINRKIQQSNCYEFNSDVFCSFALLKASTLIGQISYVVGKPLCLLVNSAVKHQAPGPRWAPLHAPRIGSELPGEKRRDAQERVIRHPLGNKQKTMENHDFFLMFNMGKSTRNGH